MRREAQKSGASATSRRPPCPLAATFGTPSIGCRQLPVRCDDPQPARTLGHQHAAVGEELQAPGMFQAAGENRDHDRRWGSGRRSGLLGMGERVRSADEQSRDEK